MSGADVLPLLVLALLLTSAPAGAGDALPGPIPARVVQVIDGDTLAVRALIWLDHEVTARVRLDGIDTPELRGRCARETELAEAARALMRRLAEPGEVLLHDIRHDKYGGRVRARVATRDGTDLAEALVRAGLARRYRGEARQPWCEVAARP